MATRFHSEAVLLRAVAYGEADRVCTFLTRDFGRVSAFARAARRSSRRFRGGLLTFARLSIAWKARGDGALVALEESEILQAWPALGSDLLRAACAATTVELIEATVPDGQGNAALFERVVRFLSWLASETRGPLFIEAGFQRMQLALLDETGVLGPLDRSTRSGKLLAEFHRPVLLFDGGLVDQDERRGGEAGMEIEATAAAHLEALRLGRFPSPPRRPDLLEARQLLDRWWAHTLGRDLRTRGFLLEALSASGST